MYISPKASRIRQREAQRRPRQPGGDRQGPRPGPGHTRRDLIRWGIFTASGALACKNGLSPLARSAFAAVPTGTPRSPLFGAPEILASRMNRLNLQHPVPDHAAPRAASEIDADVRRHGYANEPNARRLVLSHGILNPPTRHDQRRLHQSDHRPGPDGGTPAGRNLCASALGGVLPQGRLRLLAGRRSQPDRTSSVRATAARRS